MRSRELVIATGALAAVLWFAMPATPWEFDELLFVQSIQHYDPLVHHPPPPGYPLFVFAAKAARLLFRNNFVTLVWLNYLASIAAFALLAIAFARLADDAMRGIAGAVLFFFAPSMIVDSTLAMSDPGAVALVAAALFVRNPALAGGFAALAVGWRPQFAIFVVPWLFVTIARTRGWRNRAVAAGVFAVVCVAWLVPLVVATGGVDRLIRFESSQAGYLAQHDADVSRSGWTPPMVAARFIAHPWGTKVMSFPVLALAAFGAWWSLRTRNWRVLPLAIAGIAYLAFALRFMDPADGARYAIPVTLVVAFFGGVGLAKATEDRGPRTEAVALAVFAAGSLIYTSSVISQRAGSPSPPFRAAQFAKWTYPQNAVVLYELPLWPHAQVFFAGREQLRVDDGLAQYFDRPDVPLFLYADGVSHAPGARAFQWAPSDAYSKLTRNHYRVVSVIPMPPERRFRAVRGVYVPEREIEGDEWRWLDSPAAIQLPHGGARTVTLRVGLPVLSPIEVNTLTITVDGAPARTVEVHRGQRLDVALPVPAGAPLLGFTAARTFVPAEVPGSLNRDPRRLAVKLYDLRSGA